MSVSVIIPTYNRFQNVINAINSVKKQDYKSIEIIVVDDCSSNIDYNNLEDIDDIKYVKLPKNSKEMCGYPCGAVARNLGMKVAKNEYICFLDDDDIMLPNKLNYQINKMIENNILFSCTEGFIGRGFYNKDKNYKLYNGEHYKHKLKVKFNLDINEDFPDIFTKSFINKHNMIITSSVIFHKSLIEKVGYMELIKNGGQIIDNTKKWQDYEYWKKLLDYTNCLYIKKPLFYYDLNKY